MFTIRLQAATRMVPEGDLRLSLFVDDLPLHHINFSWLQVGASLEEAKNFHKTYDNFWQSLGGTDDDGLGIYIPVPAHDKPLTQASNSHRKRARIRRSHWAAIEAATIATLAPHFSAAP